MIRPAVIHLSLIALVLSIVPAISPAQDAAKIPVLLIDGQNNHDWAATTRKIVATLNKTGRFEVTVSTSPGRKGTKEEWAAWRPDFSKAKVVLSNYNGQPWPEEVRKGYTEFVEAGGGAVNVHAANNAFQGWKTWNRMIGLGWRGNKFGERVTIDDKTGKQIRTPVGEGPGAGHGPQHAFLITVREPNHPIMKGLPNWWLHAKDELYHGQRGPGQNMTILSSAYSAKEKRGTGQHEPITWVIPHGKGHVVTTVLGHVWRGQKEHPALHCVGFQTIVARSCEWAATGKVTIPVPAAFPTDKKISLVDPDKLDWSGAR